MTSKLVSAVCPERLISSPDNGVAATLLQVYSFFKDWTHWVEGSSTLTAHKNLLSQECREDINSLCLGFQSMSKRFLSEHKGSSFDVTIMNSDVVENVFCCQRSLCHGANTNPTYVQYCGGINTMLHTWPITIGKGNARIKADPFTLVQAKKPCLDL